MTLLIRVPDRMAHNLRKAAKRQHLSAEVFALRILEKALEPEPELSVEEVVAKIKALPRKAENVRPARGSLVAYLQNAPQDPEFNLEVWQKEWAKVEAEMKSVSRANDEAEGRR